MLVRSIKLHPSVTSLSTPLGGIVAVLRCGTRKDLTCRADRHRAAPRIVKTRSDIDFALERAGIRAAPHDAIYQASLLRFRPIMMTTMAALLGAAPLAFASGTGAELRRPLGITIVGGLLVSQVLTLYTTPVIYLAFERISARARRLVSPSAHASGNTPEGPGSANGSVDKR